MRMFEISLLLFECLASRLGFTAAEKFCEHNWSYFNASCWRKQETKQTLFPVTKEVRKSFPLNNKDELSKAIKSCEATGANVASVHSEHEWSHFLGLADGERVWLGATDWWPEWTDGSTWNLSLIPWCVSWFALSSTQPLFSIIVVGGEAWLNDYPSKNPYTGNVICAKPSECKTVMDLEGDNATCPASWEGFGERCFASVRGGAHPFPHAEAACSAAGGSAATVRSAEELQWLGKTADFGPLRDVLVGLHLPQTSVRVFRWLDGAETDFLVPLSLSQLSKLSGVANRGRMHAGVVEPHGEVYVAQAGGDGTYKAPLLPALCRKALSETLGSCADCEVFKTTSEADLPRAVECAERCAAEAGCQSWTSDANACTLSHERDLVFLSQQRAVSAKPEAAEPVKRLPRSCSEIKDLNGSAESGVYEVGVAVEPTASVSPTRVFCDMDTLGGGWTTIQKRQDGTGNFESREYADYKAGFGDAESDYWLGLHNILTITARKEQDLLVVLRQESQPSCYLWALYSNFRLLNAWTYEFDFDSFDGTLDDILTPLKGVGFGKGSFCHESAGDACGTLAFSEWDAEDGHCKFDARRSIDVHSGAAAACQAAVPGGVLKGALNLPAFMSNGSVEQAVARGCVNHPACAYIVSPAHLDEPPSDLAVDARPEPEWPPAPTGKCASMLPGQEPRTIVRVGCDVVKPSGTRAVWCSSYAGRPEASGLWWVCGHGHANARWEPGCHRLNSSFDTLPANWAKIHDPKRRLAYEGAAEIRMMLRDSDFARKNASATNWCPTKLMCDD